VSWRRRYRNKENDMLRLVLIVSLPVLVIAALSATATSAARPVTCDGLEATIVGTQGDDMLDGTAGNDVIAGLGGDDTITGGLGDDVICGGSGDDTIAGQGDDDRLFGEQGNDVLDGGEGGCCFVPTNTGDDLLHGGPGDDELHTSDFPTLGSTLHGDQGEDQLFLWSGGWGYGDNGHDVIRQYSRNAVLDGGNGDDDILDWDDAGLNNETVTMLGGRGDDTLASEDTTSIASMDGGSGEDACIAGDTTAACES
jgi:Ca2+-binding RTX toxin-like protein